MNKQEYKKKILFNFNVNFTPKSPEELNLIHEFDFYLSTLLDKLILDEGEILDCMKKEWNELYIHSADEYWLPDDEHSFIPRESAKALINLQQKEL